MVVYYRRFRTTYRSHFQGSFHPNWPWRWSNRFPETSVRNFLYSLRNNPQQRSSHPLPAAKPISCMYYGQFFKTNAQYRSETFNFIFWITNIVYTVSLNVRCCYEQETDWEDLGKMCADVGKQTVTGWCEILRNRKISLFVLCTRHKFIECM